MATFIPGNLIRYSTHTLVGNWYEDRLVDQIDRKAVVPGVFGKSDCAKWSTEFQLNYNPPNFRETGLEYNLWKRRAFRNRLKSEATAVKMFDGQQFDRNFTTMGDLMFDIKAKRAIKFEQHKTHELQRMDVVDPLDSYGNVTQYGLLKSIACDMKRDRCYNWCTSTYRESYPLKKPYPMTKAKKP